MNNFRGKDSGKNKKKCTFTIPGKLIDKINSTLSIQGKQTWKTFVCPRKGGILLQSITYRNSYYYQLKDPIRFCTNKKSNWQKIRVTGTSREPIQNTGIKK